MVSKKGLDLMKESVENRLLCCNVRKVQPLTKHLDGLDAWVTGLRRDQWATRTNIRKVEIDHDHGAIVKLNPLAEWTKREVWAYLGENDVPVHGLYAQGYTSIGCAPCTRAIGEGEDDRAGRWWWESNAPKECGMHCSIEHGGFEHELKAILGKDAGALIALHGDAAEVALGEAQAVLALVQDGERRGRLADLVAAVQDGELGDDEAQALEELIELGLSTGRIRSIYGPEGEQAALKTFRKLPGGRALSESAAEVTEALGGARGQDARAGEGAVDWARRRSSSRSASRGSSSPSGSIAPARASTPSVSDHYVACLDLSGRACLVVGSGAMAREKVDGLEGVRRATSTAVAPADYDARAARRRLARRRGDERRRAEPPHLRGRERAPDLLQRRRRARALLVHPAGTAPARADHACGVDRRRVARARAVAARQVRGADRLRARAARGRAAPPAPVGEAEPAHLRGAPRLLPRTRDEGTRHERCSRRRRPRRSGADHRARPRARADMRGARLRPARRGRDRRTRRRSERCASRATG